MASISDRVGDLGGYLREQREHARLSVRQLATLAGVSNPYLSQVERGLRRPSAEVLQQIARGLRISAEALYVRAGILDEEGRPDVESAVHADPELNDRQRRVLLDIYASFIAENRRAAESDREAATPARSAARRKGSGSGRPAADLPPGAQLEPVRQDEPVTAPTPQAEPGLGAERGGVPTGAVSTGRSATRRTKSTAARSTKRASSRDGAAAAPSVPAAETATEVTDTTAADDGSGPNKQL